jgi:hypothetical protein
MPPYTGVILLLDKTIVVLTTTPGPHKYFDLFQKIIICSKILANLMIGFFYDGVLIKKGDILCHRRHSEGYKGPQCLFLMYINQTLISKGGLI